MLHAETQPIEIETGPFPSATIIWLHGLGADGNDFVPIVSELQLPAGQDIRFIFPHAPVQPVTINGGMHMRAWYDIAGIGAGYPEDEHGICQSQQLLCQLIEQEKGRGIATNRIVLAGFSQGGAIVLHSGLRFEEPLAGIMALSTYLPLADQFVQERQQGSHGNNIATPVFIAHGREDTVIPMSYAEKSRQQLMALQYPVEWHEYAMPHSVCNEELLDISRWLQRIL